MDRDSILAVIVAQIRDVVPELEGRAIGGGDSMADLGLDSIERTEVVMNTRSFSAPNCGAAPSFDIRAAAPPAVGTR